MSQLFSLLKTEAVVVANYIHPVAMQVDKYSVSNNHYLLLSVYNDRLNFDKNNIMSNCIFSYFYSHQHDCYINMLRRYTSHFNHRKVWCNV